MTSPQTRCQFGTVATGRVYFDLQATGRDVSQVPDWDQPTTTAIHVVPGSNPPVVEVDLIAFGPATVTWRLAFDSQTDYRAMRAKLGQQDTLTVPATLQSHTGTLVPGEAVPYVALASTHLIALETVETDVSGPVEANATFLRTIDPLTGAVQA